MNSRLYAMERADSLASRRRMSMDELSTIFLASGACPRVPRQVMERAQLVVTIEQAEAVIIGPTFGDTVALNRPLLDLYEAAPEVRRLEASCE